jgi:hypothetical protein
MGATSFTRLVKERSGSLNDQGIWEIREKWQAKWDYEVTDPLEFLGDPLLPSIGTAHPENALLFLKGVGGFAPPIDGSLMALDFVLIWATNGIAAANRHDPDRYVDGLRATKSWGHRVVQEPVEKAFVSDDDGATWSDDELPVENTVDDLFVPGLTRNRYMPTCRYSRNELVVPVTVLELPGLVNNDAFTLDGRSVAIGQALIIAAPVSVPKRFETYEFRTIDFEILIRTEGWDESLLNRGFYCFGVTNGVKKRCLIKNGLADETEDERPYVYAEEPVSLDENGVDRTQYVDPDTFVPHFRKFRYMQRTSFTALGFT